jgi:hypothetical protein
MICHSVGFIATANQVMKLPTDGRPQREALFLTRHGDIGSPDKCVPEIV